MLSHKVSIEKAPLHGLGVAGSSIGEQRRISGPIITRDSATLIDPDQTYVYSPQARSKQSKQKVTIISSSIPDTASKLK